MQQAKLWFSQPDMIRLVNKIMSRLADIEVSKYSPYAGITQENCENYVLARVKEVVEDYGSKPAVDLTNLNLAFTFGMVLNDTVFMLAGCRYPDASVPTVICDMEHNAGAADSYHVDFYQLI